MNTIYTVVSVIGRNDLQISGNLEGGFITATVLHLENAADHSFFIMENGDIYAIYKSKVKMLRNRTFEEVKDFGFEVGNHVYDFRKEQLFFLNPNNYSVNRYDFKTSELLSKNTPLYRGVISLGDKGNLVVISGSGGFFFSRSQYHFLDSDLNSVSHPENLYIPSYLWATHHLKSNGGGCSIINNETDEVHDCGKGFEADGDIYSVTDNGYRKTSVVDGKIVVTEITKDQYRKSFVSDWQLPIDRYAVSVDMHLGNFPVFKLSDSGTCYAFRLTSSMSTVKYMFSSDGEEVFALIAPILNNPACWTLITDLSRQMMESIIRSTQQQELDSLFSKIDFHPVPKTTVESSKKEEESSN